MCNVECWIYPNKGGGDKRYISVRFWLIHVHVLIDENIETLSFGIKLFVFKSIIF